MSKLKPMDLAFFALENQHRPMHMAAFELFELPKNSPKNVTESTVKWHLGNIYSKMGVKKRTQAIANGRQLGLIS